MTNFDSGSPLFIEKKDLGSVIYSYQIDQITESNDDIVFQEGRSRMASFSSCLSICWKGKGFVLCQSKE